MARIRKVNHTCHPTVHICHPTVAGPRGSSLPRRPVSPSRSLCPDAHLQHPAGTNRQTDQTAVDFADCRVVKTALGPDNTLAIVVR